MSASETTVAPKDPEDEILAYLRQLQNQVRRMIAERKCRCGVGGLAMCKRCVMLDPRYS